MILFIYITKTFTPKTCTFDELTFTLFQSILE